MCVPACLPASLPACLWGEELHPPLSFVAASLPFSTLPRKSPTLQRSCVWVPLPVPTLQRALLRTAQEVAKGMGYIHEFNIGGWRGVGRVERAP